MNKYLLLLAFINLPVLATKQLDKYCKKKKGVILKSYTCPKTKLKLPIKTCVYKNKTYDQLFVNGCSGPSGGFSKTFFNACIAHDLCYHHEPSTSGKTQKDCDKKFFNIAVNDCSVFSGKKKNRCRGWAKTMYLSLRVIGVPAFHCADYPADYKRHKKYSI